MQKHPGGAQPRLATFGCAPPTEKHTVPGVNNQKSERKGGPLQAVKSQNTTVVPNRPSKAEHKGGPSQGSQNSDQKVLPTKDSQTCSYRLAKTQGSRNISEKHKTSIRKENDEGKKTENDVNKMSPGAP